MNPPTLQDVQDLRARWGDLVRVTPAWSWQGPEIAALLAPGTEAVLKLELFQHAGSFKVRGAFSNLLDLTDEERRRGVTAVSAGNHAMAVGHAAAALGVSAKVVMPTTANAARVEGCRRTGAEIVQVEGLSNLFTEVKRIEQEEGRAFLHPFEGFRTLRGTATLGLEFAEQVPDLDAVVVPIGGGGLCAGVSFALKQANPACQVFGVEPEGADTMHRSFASGQVEHLTEVNTIADSLAAPFTAPMSLAMCRQYVDDLVKVDDDALCQAMGLLFREAKLAVEPAGAAATAALLGPLRERLAGKRVGALVCGSNVDRESFGTWLARGEGYPGSLSG